MRYATMITSPYILFYRFHYCCPAIALLHLNLNLIPLCSHCLCLHSYCTLFQSLKNLSWKCFYFFIVRWKCLLLALVKNNFWYTQFAACVISYIHRLVAIYLFSISSPDIELLDEVVGYFEWETYKVKNTFMCICSIMKHQKQYTYHDGMWQYRTTKMPVL